MPPVAWKQWEGQVVDLCLPLRRYLGGTDRSAVFLTQYGDGEPRNAAIKLILAEPNDSELLSQWERAAQLSHPHLLRLLRSGTCQVNQLVLHYAVSEYAEENLAEVLAERPLTAAEVAEMLPPLLDALAYIHGEGLVHGHLKPANIMAVGDQLKLSVDGISTVGELGVAAREPSAYDSPEFGDRGCSPPGDVWSFGITLVEALTQRLPGKQEPVLPETLPAEFAGFVRACLQPDPRRRAPLSEIVAMVQGTAPVQPAAPVATPAAPRNWRRLALAGTGALVLAAILGAPRLLQGPAPSATVAAAATERPVQRAAVAMPAPRAPARAGGIVQQVLPDVPAQARRTIRGKVTINVRAGVDATGRVTSARLVSPNSRYFGDRTLKAVEQWAFEPADASSEWLLRFEFTTKGTEVRPSRVAR